MVERMAHRLHLGLTPLNHQHVGIDKARHGKNIDRRDQRRHVDNDVIIGALQ